MKTQTRGICQCCGREQAALNGTGFMSQHGYTVENGWFNGVCGGHQFAPMQKSTAITYKIIADVRDQCEHLEIEIENLRNGSKHPEQVRARDFPEVMVPWNEASDWQQKRGVDRAIWGAESRIRAGRSFANDMEQLAMTVYGTDLKVVTIEDAPKPVEIGEKRKASNGVDTLICFCVKGARIWWKRESDGRKSWTGVGAWRKLELI